jgi:gamma-glutamyltranspeptidase/glutathione hydrolase
VHNPDDGVKHWRAGTKKFFAALPVIRGEGRERPGHGGTLAPMRRALRSTLEVPSPHGAAGPNPAGPPRGARTWLLAAVLVAACRAPTSAPAPPYDPPASTGEAADTAPVRALPAGEPDGQSLALGIHGAVTSQEDRASEVGLAVLQAGGNAVDAAVAVQFALAVTHPSAGNLGGGGFMVVRMADGTASTFDYRERAPAAATRDMYLDAKGNPTDASIHGAKAAGIPGTVAGMALAHERFGTKPWAELVAPAAALARDGVVLDEWHAEDLAGALERMNKVGLQRFARYYGHADGKPYTAGERWTQPELAATLDAIASGGPRAFYSGSLAETMVARVREGGGIWSVADLEGYVAKERAPITFRYREHEVITMPPPSAGGVVLRQILAAAEYLELADKPWRSADEVHLYVESLRRAYADRNLLLGDPDYVELPMARLLDVAYIRERMAGIDPARATPSAEISAGVPLRPNESEQTTHFSVVDQWGNAVSNTTTLNTGFGSKFVVEGLGFVLNNEMDDFAVKPGTANVYGLVQGEQNAIAPGKRMLSSMTPTILVKDGELRAVVGTPGGPTITTTVAQIIRAVVDYGMPIDRAVASVRIHHQWLPDAIWTEDRVPAELEAQLQARGHQIRKRGAIGHANCIEVDPATRGFRAVADVARDGGKAVAY